MTVKKSGENKESKEKKNESEVIFDQAVTILDTFGKRKILPKWSNENNRKVFVSFGLGEEYGQAKDHVAREELLGKLKEKVDEGEEPNLELLQEKITNNIETAAESAIEDVEKTAAAEAARVLAEAEAAGANSPGREGADKIANAMERVGEVAVGEIKKVAGEEKSKITPELKKRIPEIMDSFFRIGILIRNEEDSKVFDAFGLLKEAKEAEFGGYNEKSEVIAELSKKKEALNAEEESFGWDLKDTDDKINSIIREEEKLLGLYNTLEEDIAKNPNSEIKYLLDSYQEQLTLISQLKKTIGKISELVKEVKKIDDKFKNKKIYDEIVLDTGDGNDLSMTEYYDRKLGEYNIIEQKIKAKIEEIQANKKRAEISNERENTELDEETKNKQIEKIKKHLPDDLKNPDEDVEKVWGMLKNQDDPSVFDDEKKVKQAYLLSLKKVSASSDETAAGSTVRSEKIPKERKKSAKTKATPTPLPTEPSSPTPIRSPILRQENIEAPEEGNEDIYFEQIKYHVLAMYPKTKYPNTIAQEAMKKIKTWIEEDEKKDGKSRADYYRDKKVIGDAIKEVIGEAKRPAPAPETPRTPAVASESKEQAAKESFEIIKHKLLEKYPDISNPDGITQRIINRIKVWVERDEKKDGKSRDGYFRDESIIIDALEEVTDEASREEPTDEEIKKMAAKIISDARSIGPASRDFIRLLKVLGLKDGGESLDYLIEKIENRLKEEVPEEERRRIEEEQRASDRPAPAFETPPNTPEPPLAPPPPAPEPIMARTAQEILQAKGFVDIEPILIFSQLSDEDLDKIKVFLSEKDGLFEVKNFLTEKINNLAKDLKLEDNLDAGKIEEISQKIYEILQKSLEAEAKSQLVKLDKSKAKQIGLKMAYNVGVAMVIGAGAAAIISSGGLAAAATGGILAMRSLIRSKYDKGLDTLLGKGGSKIFKGDKKTIEDKLEEAKQSLMAGDFINRGKISAIISNEIRNSTSERARLQIGNFETARADADNNPTPENLKKFEKSLPAASFQFFQNALKYIEAEFENLPPEEQQNMAMQIALTLVQYERNHVYEPEDIRELKDKNPKFIQILEKFSKIRAGKIEGLGETVEDKLLYGAATVALGAGLSYAIRGSSAGRIVAGALAGASAGLMAEKYFGSKEEQNILRQVENLITEAEIKIKDTWFISGEINNLRKDAIFVQAKLNLGLLDMIPLLKSRAENFIHNVNQLEIKQEKSLDSLLEQVGENTENLIAAKAKEIKKVEEASGNKKYLFIIGGALAGVAVGYAGAWFADWRKGSGVNHNNQLENNSGGKDVRAVPPIDSAKINIVQLESVYENKLDAALDNSGISPQIKERLLDEIAGRDIKNVKDLGLEELKKIFPDGKLDQNLFGLKLVLAYEGDFQDNVLNNYGLDIHKLVNFSGSPEKQMEQLADFRDMFDELVKSGLNKDAVAALAMAKSGGMPDITARLELVLGKGNLTAEAMKKFHLDGGNDLESVLRSQGAQEIGGNIRNVSKALEKILAGQSDVVKQKFIETQGIEFDASRINDQVKQAIGRVSVDHNLESLNFERNVVLLKEDGLIDVIQAEANKGPRIASEAALRANYAGEILGIKGVTEANIANVSSRSFDLDLQGQKIHIDNAGSSNPDIRVEDVKVSFEGGKITGIGAEKLEHPLDPTADNWKKVANPFDGEWKADKALDKTDLDLLAQLGIKEKAAIIDVEDISELAPGLKLGEGEKLIAIDTIGDHRPDQYVLIDPNNHPLAIDKSPKGSIREALQTVKGEIAKIDKKVDSMQSLLGGETSRAQTMEFIQAAKQAGAPVDLTAAEGAAAGPENLITVLKTAAGGDLSLLKTADSKFDPTQISVARGLSMRPVGQASIEDILKLTKKLDWPNPMRNEASLALAIASPAEGKAALESSFGMQVGGEVKFRNGVVELRDLHPIGSGKTADIIIDTNKQKIHVDGPWLNNRDFGINEINRAIDYAKSVTGGQRGGTVERITSETPSGGTETVETIRGDGVYERNRTSLGK